MGLGRFTECGGSFVEKEDLGVAEEGAGDGDALFLTAREEGTVEAAFAIHESAKQSSNMV